jgi:hypothetical protein
MTDTYSDARKNTSRKRITSPSFFVGNEVINVFLPLMGPDCLAVYAYLKQREFINPTLRHSVREVSASINRSISTASRSLEVLEHLKLVRLTHFGGNKESECELLDSKTAALSFGAVYSRASVSWSLPEQVRERLEGEIGRLRRRQQGKLPPQANSAVRDVCGNRLFSVSQRNASVSPEARQRIPRETQMGTHLIQEEGRIERIPSPNPPAQDEQAEETKDSPDEDEPDPDLKWARVKFTGVMKDMGSHLLDTSRPPNPRFANGAADWNEFGFNSLAVEAATWRGETLELSLFACDPAAARRGLEKYHRAFDASFRARYGCEVKTVLVKPYRR